MKNVDIVPSTQTGERNIISTNFKLFFVSLKQERNVVTKEVR